MENTDDSVLGEQLVRARAEIRRLQVCLEEKNRALDAMHYVWCSGGCKTGTHRWTQQNITESVVEEAERNTRRLRAWFESSKLRRAD